MTKEKPKRRVKIASTGFYAPEKILTNADLEKMVDTTDEWIVSRSGIKERRIASADQATSDLCIEAARRALRNGHFKVEDIDLIIVATATPDTLFPSTACWVQDGLRADHVVAFDIGAGCTGFLYGLILAESLILSGVSKRILFIGGEILTKITNWKDRATCVLFGDAAGAAVLEESRDESGILSHYWKADGSLAGLLYMPAGGTRMPASAKTVAENLHTLQMKGNEVFKHAVKRMGESAVEALKRAGLNKEDIRWFIPHQANIRIIDATAERLGVPPEKVYVNIQRYGNVSVACIPISLHELHEAGKLKKGDVVLMDAFGAGFTWAAVAYRW
ncbi:MAG TPA: beta-ketoacyl-ACP synthase III [Candidatus Desulfaltia sp.]|nr:beta-ketoacyl-ACP synthase III [Candidatus Desulfaltia sp.]